MFTERIQVENFWYQKKLKMRIFKLQSKSTCKWFFFIRSITFDLFLAQSRKCRNVGLDIKKGHSRLTWIIRKKIKNVFRTLDQMKKNKFLNSNYVVRHLYLELELPSVNKKKVKRSKTKEKTNNFQLFSLKYARHKFTYGYRLLFFFQRKLPFVAQVLETEIL